MFYTSDNIKYGWNNTMKHLYLLVFALLLALSLSAQTGLFDISYDDSYEYELEALENWEYPFYLDYKADHEARFIPWDNDYVDSILLVLGSDNSAVVGWIITYNPQEEEDIMDLVFEWAEYYHEDEWIYLDEEECYFWDLGNSRSLSLGYDESGYLVATYYDSDFDEFFPE